MGYYGLGQADPTEGGECPQPVHYTERDALRDQIKGWTAPFAGPHWHEDHPDLRAVFTDIVNRLRGLEQRPQLLRCSAEGRSRAVSWMRQLEDLRRRVEQRGTTDLPGCRATTWVRIQAPFQFSVHRGPTYTIRPGSTREDCFTSGAAPSSGAPAAGPTESTAPPGSVVVGGQVYPSSAAATAATKEPVQTVGGGGAWQPPAAYAGAPGGGGFLEGELIPGVPTTYLVYGVGALLLFRMLKGR